MVSEQIEPTYVPAYTGHGRFNSRCAFEISLQQVSMSDDALKAALRNLSGREFEEYLEQLWTARGWDASVTSHSGDDGVDVMATKTDSITVHCAIQAKHRSDEAGTVGSSTVQKYAYLHQKSNVDVVVLATTGGFTDSAKQSAQTANIKLIDLDEVVRLTKDVASDDALNSIDATAGLDIDPPEEPTPEDDYWEGTAADVPDENRQRIEEYAHSKAAFTRPLSMLGHESAPFPSRLGVLLQLFRGEDQLHVLLCADTADRFTDLYDQVLNFEPNSTIVEGHEATREDFRGRYSTAGEATIGFLREYDGGIVSIRDIDSLTDAFWILSTPMLEGKFTATAREYHEEFQTSTSIFATTQAVSARNNSYTSVLEKFDIDRRLLDRFTYTNATRMSEEEVTLPDGYSESPQEPPDDAAELLRQHIALADQISPEHTEESRTLIQNIASELNRDEEEDTDSQTKPPRWATEEWIEANRDELEQLDDPPTWFEYLNGEYEPPQETRIENAAAESLHILSRASARVRLSDTIGVEDVHIALMGLPAYTSALEIDELQVRKGTEQYDTEVVETGTSKSQRDHVKNIKGLIASIEEDYTDGAPLDEVMEAYMEEFDQSPTKAEIEIEKLRTKGEVYEPKQGHLRTT